MNWKIQIQIFVAFILFGSAAATFNNQPFARLFEYSAFGTKNVTQKGNSANLFLGLPYAKPPLNESRFEKPQPLTPSLTKVVHATDWPLACHQVVDARSQGINSSEDCLFLNVMTPSKPSLKLRNVLVFIHGGGYEYGFAEEYGWEYFVDNFITRDVILVTLQYRLAHFGFLATEDGEINGNFGHFDQIEALKFVKRNILAFGGNPNEITLAGHSAGSVSVHTLSLSPKTRGLYSKEIHIAGSNYAQWPVDNKVVMEHSKLISTAVGCPQTNTKARKACLKKVDYTKFWEVRTQLNLTDFPYDIIDILYWTSVYDNDLFEGKSLEQLQKVSPKRKTLYGVDAGEGLLWSLYTTSPITNVFAVGRGFTPENRGDANAETIKKLLRMLMTNSVKFPPAIQEEVIAKIFDFYKIGGSFATYPLHYFDKYTELYSDIIMKVPMGKEIEAKIGYGFKEQYMFIFNYTRPIDRPIIGDLPGHGYFLMYFAGLEIYTQFGINQTATDISIQNNLADMFVSFIKSGKPQSNGVSCPKISASRLPYMEFNTGVVIDDVDFTPKVHFWDQLDSEYSWDFIRGVPL